MEQNTAQLVDLYNRLGAKVDANGEPILSVYQTVVTTTTTTTFMKERKFDSTNGAEQGSLSHEIDVPALDTSASEVQGELDTISAIKDLGAQVNPSAPIKISTGIKANPPVEIKP